jgi:CRISPR system Cascade subunit CasB
MTAEQTMSSKVDQQQTSAEKREGSRGAVALAWWSKLRHPERGDPGTLARLRRARTHLELIRIPAAVDLARRLGVLSTRDSRLIPALELARVLAHAKEHDNRHPMEAAGWKRFPGSRKASEAGDDRPKMSEARFNRFLEIGEGEEKILAFARLIQLLDGKVNVVRIADDFLLWNHPEFGEKVREQWAFRYLAAGSAAPAAPSTETEDQSE